MPWKPIDPYREARERQRRRAMELARPRRHNRPYKRSEWRKTREEKLAAFPLCEICRSAAATEVDHINADPWDNRQENLRSACKPCHSARTMRDLNQRLTLARKSHVSRPAPCAAVTATIVAADAAEEPDGG